MLSTYTDYLNQWNSQYPNQVWLRERNGDADTDWSWHQAHTEINAIACWLESRFETTGHRIGLLSRNRAHWYFADLGACAAGHVVVPMFTTASSETADYVMNFTEMKVLFVGETENWDQVRRVLPEGILLIALPGVELAEEHLRWEDLAAPFREVWVNSTSRISTFKCFSFESSSICSCL